MQPISYFLPVSIYEQRRNIFEDRFLGRIMNIILVISTNTLTPLESLAECSRFLVLSWFLMFEKCHLRVQRDTFPPNERGVLPRYVCLLSN